MLPRLRYIEVMSSMAFMKMTCIQYNLLLKWFMKFVLVKNLFSDIRFLFALCECYCYKDFGCYQI